MFSISEMVIMEAPPHLGLPDLHLKNQAEFHSPSPFVKVLAMDHEAALGLHRWRPQGENKNPSSFGWWKIADTLKTLTWSALLLGFRASQVPNKIFQQLKLTQ